MVDLRSLPPFGPVRKDREPKKAEEKKLCIFVIIIPYGSFFWHDDHGAV
jgi:hypothetical protein